MYNSAEYMTPSPAISPLTPGGEYSPRTPGSPMDSGMGMRLRTPHSARQIMYCQTVVLVSFPVWVFSVIVQMYDVYFCPDTKG